MGSGEVEGGLRTPHVNLITWQRAVWDTWGYRIRPTAWRGARSTRELKGPVFAPPPPPLHPPTRLLFSPTPPYLLWRAETGAHFSASPRSTKSPPSVGGSEICWGQISLEWNACVFTALPGSPRVRRGQRKWGRVEGRWGEGGGILLRALALRPTP